MTESLETNLEKNISENKKKPFKGKYDRDSLENYFTTDPEGKPDPLDVKSLRKNKLTKEAHDLFVHNCNGLNSIYCRTMDLLTFLGRYEYLFQDEKRNKKIAIFIGKFCEKNIYNGNGGSRLSKGLNFLRHPLSYSRDKSLM